MKITLVCIISLLSFSIRGEKIYSFDSTKIKNQQVMLIVKKMSSYSRMEASAIGVAGLKGEQYSRFENLIKQAKENELIELTKYPNSIVRCYSFWALAKLYSNKTSIILEEHINDNEKVGFMSGCMTIPYTVIEFMIDVVTPDMLDSKCYKLSVEKIKLLKEKAKIN